MAAKKPNLKKVAEKRSQAHATNPASAPTGLSWDAIKAFMDLRDRAAAAGKLPGYANNGKAYGVAAPTPASIAAGVAAPTQTQPPPINPFLSPTDIANKTLELGTYDDYMKGLVQQLDQQRRDSEFALANIEQSKAQGIESNNWNSAARGLQASSIKNQAQAKMVGDAQAATQNVQGKLDSFRQYVGDQQYQVDTKYKPAVETKYAGIAKQNASDLSAQQGPPETPPEQPAAGAAPPKPAVPQALGNAAQPTGRQSNQETYQPVVKGGKFYHYYKNRPAGHQWVYMGYASR